MRGYERLAVERCALSLSRPLEIFLPAVSDQSARQSLGGARRCSGWACCVADAVASAGAAESFFASLGLGVTSAGFSGAVVLRPAALGAALRVAVLLLVFVAIVFPLKFRSWLKRPRTEPC